MLSVPQESAAVVQKIAVYATPWCGDCWHAKRWFDAPGIPYDSINGVFHGSAAAERAAVSQDDRKTSGERKASANTLHPGDPAKYVAVDRTERR